MPGRGGGMPGGGMPGGIPGGIPGGGTAYRTATQWHVVSGKEHGFVRDRNAFLALGVLQNWGKSPHRLAWLRLT